MGEASGECRTKEELSFRVILSRYLHQHYIQDPGGYAMQNAMMRCCHKLMRAIRVGRCDPRRGGAIHQVPVTYRGQGYHYCPVMHGAQSQAEVGSYRAIPDTPWIPKGEMMESGPRTRDSGKLDR